jgi:hypothetical protein
VGFLQLNSGEGETREIGKESRQGRGKVTYIRMYSKPKMNVEINHLRRYLYRKANRR